jgi:hypothetical protein
MKFTKVLLSGAVAGIVALFSASNASALNADPHAVYLKTQDGKR